MKGKKVVGKYNRTIRGVVVDMGICVLSIFGGVALERLSNAPSVSFYEIGVFLGAAVLFMNAHYIIHERIPKNRHGAVLTIIKSFSMLGIFVDMAAFGVTSFYGVVGSPTPIDRAPFIIGATASLGVAFIVEISLKIYADKNGFK